MNEYKLKLETTKITPVNYNVNHVYIFIKGEPLPVGYLKDERPVLWGFHANRFEMRGRTFMDLVNNHYSNDELHFQHKKAQKLYEAMKDELYAKGIIKDVE